MIDNAECGVDIVRRENKVPKARHPFNPNKTEGRSLGLIE